MNQADEMIPAIAAPRAFMIFVRQSTVRPFFTCTTCLKLHWCCFWPIFFLYLHNTYDSIKPLLHSNPSHKNRSTSASSLIHDLVDTFNAPRYKCLGSDFNPEKWLPNIWPSLPRTAPPRAPAQHRSNGRRLTSPNHALLNTKNDTNARTNL
jgi:hypothetical protein